MRELKSAVPGSKNPPRLMKSNHCDTNHIVASGIKQAEIKSNKIVDIQKVNNMNQVALQNNRHEVSNTQPHFNAKQIEILKNSICKGVSNEEFEIFLMACHKTQLDPFMKQIYAVKRKMKRADGSWGESMTIQTGIDGYRLIAERTGRYVPGAEPTYVHDDNGHLISATAYIKKMTADGTWHTVSASAYLDEYCQTFIDKGTGEKKPMGMWANMPRTMLSKCAESQALRKAFPAEMSNVYTKEEMLQAEVEEVSPRISFEQVVELTEILDQCSYEYREWLFGRMKDQFKANDISQLPAEMYDRMKAAAIKNMEKNIASMQAQELPSSEEIESEDE